MYDHMVGRAASVVSPFYSILPGLYLPSIQYSLGYISLLFYAPWVISPFYSILPGLYLPSILYSLGYISLLFYTPWVISPFYSILPGLYLPSILYALVPSRKYRMSQVHLPEEARIIFILFFCSKADSIKEKEYILLSTRNYLYNYFTR